jgi:hypothetical protein
MENKKQFYESAVMAIRACRVSITDREGVANLDYQSLDSALSSLAKSQRIVSFDGFSRGKRRTIKLGM